MDWHLCRALADEVERIPVTVGAGAAPWKNFKTIDLELCERVVAMLREAANCFEAKQWES